MISLSLSQAAEVLHGDLHGQDLTIDAVTTDTRKSPQAVSLWR